MIEYQPDMDLDEELYSPEEVQESIRRGVVQAEAGQVKRLAWVTEDDA